MRITVTASKKTNRSGRRHFVVSATKEVNSATYIDEQGVMGEPGETYDEEFMKSYWEENKDSDPVLEDYSSYNEWWADTKSYLKELDDVEGGCHGGKKSVKSATIVETDLSDAYMMMCYEPGTAEEGIEGDEIYPICIFRAADIDDARAQVAQYCDENGLDQSEYYADYYNSNFIGDDNTDEPVFDSLADYTAWADSNDDTMYTEEIDEDLEDVTALDAATDIEAYTDPDSEWEIVERKQVMDSDGFYTDYTLYHNILTDKYACMFGDTDLYSPEDGYFDWEGDTEEEAYEWFESYNGFEDDEDIYSSEEIDDKKEDVDDKVDEDADDETKEDISGEKDIMCSVELSDEQQSKLDEIANRYTTSDPVSGDWDKEEEHEQKAISDELGVSMEDAKQIMKDYLGFED